MTYAWGVRAGREAGGDSRPLAESWAGGRPVPKPDALPLAAHACLRTLIAGHVIPAMARRGSRVTSGPPSVAARLALASLDSDRRALWAEVEALRDAGTPLAALFLEGLAGAARHLGDDWLGDRLSFSDVTCGTAALQAVARRLGGDLEDEGAPLARQGAGSEPTILLATVPGEQHTFGLSILAAFFRRAGWGVACEPGADAAALVARAATERFSAIGLSGAGDRSVAAMPGLIAAIRRASPGIGVLVGGPAFTSAVLPSDGGVGADATAPAALAAVACAEGLLARRVEPGREASPCETAWHATHRAA